MKQKTAVEWLVEQLTPAIALQKKYIDELEEAAKQMEREQLEKANYEGYLDGMRDESERE